MGCPLLQLKKRHTLIQDHLIYRKGRIKSILHHQLTRTVIKYYHFYILYKQDNIMYFNKLLDTIVKENSIQSQFT